MVRMSLFQQRAETPQGRLDELWRTSRNLMTAGDKPRLPVPDDRADEWRDLICEVRDWAEKELRATGEYPDERVSQFLGEEAAASNGGPQEWAEFVSRWRRALVGNLPGG